MGGATFLAVIAAVAFATILAVVAGLTLTSSSSMSHDFYANVVRKGATSERQEVVVARVAALIIGAISIVLGILAKDLNVAFLVAGTVLSRDRACAEKYAELEVRALTGAGAH